MARKEIIPMADTFKVVGGGIVGAGLALLLAPQTGKKTRKDIVRYARNIGGKTNEAVSQLVDSIDDLVDVVGTKASEIFHDGEGLSIDAKKELLLAIEKGEARLGRQRAKLEHMFSR